MQFCKTNDLCDIKPEDLDNVQVMIRKDVRKEYIEKDIPYQYEDLIGTQFGQELENFI